MSVPKLVVAGGGALPKSIFDRFLQLAGPDPRLVYIPTASSRPIESDAILQLWRSRGFENVRILHAEKRDQAKTESFAEPVRTATAVWFGGGSQQRLADIYLNTPIERELYKLVRRGGVVGGSSAGAAIQSQTMIASGSTEPQLSKGLDLVEGAIVDQHFLRRNRISRLMQAVRKSNPPLVGLGIDEGTALVIQGDHAEVVGKSYVVRIRMDADGPTIDAFNEGDPIEQLIAPATSGAPVTKR